MNDTRKEILEEYLEYTGVKAHGKNNKIYQIRNRLNGEMEALKTYKEPNKMDTRDRQKTEMECLYYAKSKGYINTPNLISVDRSKYTTRMSWINGSHPKKLEEKHVIELSEFVRTCKPEKNEIEEIQRASDSIESINRIIESTMNRYKRVSGIYERIGTEQTVYWLKETAKREILKEAKKLEEKKDLNQWNPENYNLIFSQSDIGIHNMLEWKGKIKLIDFEYGGIDDLAKTTIDIILQPNHINRAVSNSKIISLLSDSNGESWWIERAKDITNISIIKWCLIILGEPNTVEDATQRGRKLEDYFHCINDEKSLI